MKSSIYSYVNTGDSYTNKQYRELLQAGVEVMVWTVDSIERFDELWCLGVTWIKTNKPHMFNIDVSIFVILTRDYYFVYYDFLILGNIAVLMLIIKMRIKSKFSS